MASLFDSKHNLGCNLSSQEHNLGCNLSSLQLIWPRPQSSYNLSVLEHSLPCNLSDWEHFQSGRVLTETKFWFFCFTLLNFLLEFDSRSRDQPNNVFDQNRGFWQKKFCDVIKYLKNCQKMGFLSKKLLIFIFFYYKLK